MNPFKWSADLFVGMLPAGASDMMVGSMVMLGIFATVVTVVAVVSIVVGLFVK